MSAATAISYVDPNPHPYRMKILESSEDLEISRRSALEWKGSLEKLSLDKKIPRDVLCVLGDCRHLCSEFIQQLPKLSQWKWSILALFDREGQIQTLAIFKIQKIQVCRVEQEMRVRYLFSAPWNIGSIAHLFPMKRTTKGGGSIVMHELLCRGQSDPLCKQISLCSTVSGTIFYKKIGMKQVSRTSFELSFDEKNRVEALETIAKRYLDPSNDLQKLTHTTRQKPWFFRIFR